MRSEGLSLAAGAAAGGGRVASSLSPTLPSDDRRRPAQGEF